jgi:hypothetical protein
MYRVISIAMNPGYCAVIVPVKAKFSIFISDFDLPVTSVHLNMCHFLVHVFHSKFSLACH